MYREARDVTASKKPLHVRFKASFLLEAENLNSGDKIDNLDFSHLSAFNRPVNLCRARTHKQPNARLTV